MFSFLQTPYPFYYKGKSRFLFISLVFALSCIFNYVFEPFDTNFSEHKFTSFEIILIQASVSTCIFLLFSFVLNLLSIEEKKWTLQKELLFVVVLLLFVGIGQFLMRDVIYDNPNNWSLAYLGVEIAHTLLVGFLFASIIIPINQLLLIQKYTTQAVSLNQKLPQSITFVTTDKCIDDIELSDKKVYTEKKILIHTAIEKEDFILDLSHFLYAKSDGNYVEIFVSDQNPQKLVKRITLSHFSDQLSEQEYILKIHRSYIVNLQKIKSIKGNAQGYQLELDELKEEYIPVSRSYISTFQKKWDVFRP